MKLDQFKALDAVVRAGSFAKAANEILLVTQPAVTRAIKNLEETIGFKLFSRDKYRPELTVQGAAFYKRALKILDEVDHLAYFSQQIVAGDEPEIRVSIDAYVLLPDMLKAFHSINQEFSHTQLHISCERLGSSIKKVLNRESDLGLLMWNPDYEQYKNIETKLIQRVKASTVVAPDFPLLKKKGMVRKEELAPYIQVIERTDEGHSPAVQQSEFICQHWFVSDAHAKKQIIMSGHSFGLLPYHLIEEELKQGLLVPFENLEGFRVYEREMKVACLKDREMGRAMTKLWQILGKVWKA